MPDITTPFGLRDRAMLEVLYSTGMCRSELAHLSIYDVDPERGIVTIRQGKGKKDRVVPIRDRALAWLQKYLGEGRSRRTPRREVQRRWKFKDADLIGFPLRIGVGAKSLANGQIEWSFRKDRAKQLGAPDEVVGRVVEESAQGARVARASIRRYFGPAIVPRPHLPSLLTFWRPPGNVEALLVWMAGKCRIASLLHQGTGRQRQ